MKKLLSILGLTVAFVILITLTSTVRAADTYGKVGIIKNADAQSDGTVTPEGGEAAEVTVEVTKTSLKWVKKDINAGRNSDGYWIGIKVTAPADANVNFSTMTRRAGEGEKADEDGNVTKTFEKIRDSKDGDPTQYTGLWVKVDENLLDKEEVDLMNYTFSWKKDEKDTPTVQKIKFKLVTKEVELDKGDIAVTVTIEGTKFTLTKGNTLNDLTEREKAILKALETREGYKFLGLYNGEELVNEETKFDKDVTLIARFEELPPEAEPEQTEEEKESEEELVEDEKDDTRDTGVENVYAIAGLVIMVTLAGVAVLNKRK